MDGHELLKDCVGWGASLILFSTLARQIWVQWHERSTEGVSKWLFAGQLVTSIGFIWYSALVGNTLFIVTNSVLVLTSVVGQCIYMRNRRLDRETDRSTDTGSMKPSAEGRSQMKNADGGRTVGG